MSDQNIISKSYKKLVLQIDHQNLSYIIVDLLTQKTIEVFLQKYQLYPTNNTILEDQLKKALTPLLDKNINFDQVIVLHHNHYNSLVPAAFFDPENLGLYLQYNTKVFESDLFVYDTIERYNLYNIYVPFVNLNNILLDIFKSFDYKNTTSILVQKILDLSKNKDENLVFVHYQNTHFEIVVVHNQKLLFYNSFEHKTVEDFIYYLLFTFEQLKLNPEHIKTYFIGNITQNDAAYKTAYTYIRYVFLYNLQEFATKNGASVSENSKHFILFQA